MAKICRIGKTINITYPESLAHSLKMDTNEFKKEIKMSSLVKLFELGKISSGTAAKILGISRVDFLDQVGKYKVSIFNIGNTDTLKEDALNA